jgi:hypothetical protein
MTYSGFHFSNHAAYPRILPLLSYTNSRLCILFPTCVPPDGAASIHRRLPASAHPIYSPPQDDSFSIRFPIRFFSPKLLAPVAAASLHRRLLASAPPIFLPPLLCISTPTPTPAANGDTPAASSPKDRQ